MPSCFTAAILLRKHQNTRGSLVPHPHEDLGCWGFVSSSGCLSKALTGPYCQESFAPACHCCHPCWGPGLLCVEVTVGRVQGHTGHNGSCCWHQKLRIGSPWALGFLSWGWSWHRLYSASLRTFFGSGGWKLHASVGCVDNVSEHQMAGGRCGAFGGECLSHGAQHIGLGLGTGFFFYLHHSFIHSPTHICQPSSFISPSYVSSLYNVEST